MKPNWFTTILGMLFVATGTTGLVELLERQTHVNHDYWFIAVLVVIFSVWVWKDRKNKGKPRP